MAIIADYRDVRGIVPNVELKIVSVNGGKQNGWTGVVTVMSGDALLNRFSVTVPYVSGADPYGAIYDEVGKLSMISNVRSNQPSEQPEQPEQPDHLEDIPKKSSKKKKV